MYDRTRLAMSGNPQSPLRFCRRGDLCRVRFLYEDPTEVRAVEEALCRLDPDVEVLYDAATTGSAALPGYHVYKRLAHGGCASDDRLQLVLSVQRDWRRMWPTGGPRKPGMWFVEAYRESLQPPEDIRAFNGRRRAARARKKYEAERHLRRELAAYSERGRNKNGLGGKLIRKCRQRREPGTKTTVAVG